MMFGDVNDAGKRVQKLIADQIDPGASEARALMATLTGLVVELRQLVGDLRGGKELRISLGERKE